MYTRHIYTISHGRKVVILPSSSNMTHAMLDNLSREKRCNMTHLNEHQNEIRAVIFNVSANISIEQFYS